MRTRAPSRSMRPGRGACGCLAAGAPGLLISVVSSMPARADAGTTIAVAAAHNAIAQVVRARCMVDVRERMDDAGRIRCGRCQGGVSESRALQATHDLRQLSLRRRRVGD